MCLQNKIFDNIVGKGEIAWNKWFLLSSSVFFPFGELSAILIKLTIVLCKLFQFGKWNLLLGKGLNSFEIQGKCEYAG